MLTGKKTTTLTFFRHAELSRWSQAKKARLRLSRKLVGVLSVNFMYITSFVKVDDLFADLEIVKEKDVEKVHNDQNRGSNFIPTVEKRLEERTKEIDVVKAEVLKKEDGPTDLLRTAQQEVDIQVENQVAANPEYKFRERVVRKVKNVLHDFYARNPEDKVDKQGNPKEIKIKTAEEFTLHARNFSKRFEEEISESYISFHGNKEGLEKENIEQYNIAHEIRKYFSSL